MMRCNHIGQFATLITAWLCAVPIVWAKSEPPVETAKGIEFIGCSDEAKHNLREVVDFLNLNMETLQHDTNLHRREGREKNVRRRIERKVDKLKFDCREAVLCRTSAPRDGMHAFGIMTNRLRICYDKMKSEGETFCDLTRMVTHEFGHAVGIAKDRAGQHHADKKDRVYQFGWFAEDRCEWLGQERALTAPARTPTIPQEPTTGITIYPHKDYQGWGRNFDHDVGNLRTYGQQDTTSSIKVLSGRWLVCTDSERSGNCQVLDANQPDTHALGLGDNISSIAEIEPLAEGIIMFESVGFGGDAEDLLPDDQYRDLAELDFEDRIQSVRVTDGERWELCEHDDYKGKCVLVSQDEATLKPYGMNGIISSIRPSQATPNEGVSLFDKPNYGAPRFDIDYLLYNNEFEDQEAAVLMSNRVRNLGNFNNKATSIRVHRGVWQFCAKKDWRGNCVIIRSRIADLSEIQFNNTIESAERLIPSDKQILMEVYKEPNGGGRKLVFSQANPSIADLKGTGFEDKIMSLGILGGWWQTCEHDNFRGKCKVWQASVGNLEDFGYHGQISSIRLIQY